MEPRQRLLRYVLLSVLFVHYIFQATVVSAQTLQNTVYAWDYLLTQNPSAKSEFFQLSLMTFAFGGVLVGFWRDNRLLIAVVVAILTGFSLGFPIYFHTWFLFPIDAIIIIVYCIFPKNSGNADESVS